MSRISLPSPPSTSNKTKTAVIVGGTLGTGAASARLFAQNGCGRILIVGRNEERGREMCARLEAMGKADGVQASFVRADVGSVFGFF